MQLPKLYIIGLGPILMQHAEGEKGHLFLTGPHNSMGPTIYSSQSG